MSFQKAFANELEKQAFDAPSFKHALKMNALEMGLPILAGATTVGLLHGKKGVDDLTANLIGGSVGAAGFGISQLPKILKALKKT